ncbi:hypothetical protein EI77_00278 [Prosthecobacter fusiformis]|uniref:Quinol:cytochrome c oxidoreductase quinone-binding subunit 2 n=1 Tax=Prosthecobacter fusiformis TaxID=48464 RepID=A0A4R7SRA6_9BACT|nr:hypothetical protein [Prosthecobacter fusiformis]TDU80976.1 hypothetical protein EI77_00278 [Prosthecobacter fusiformis]
MSHHVTFNDLPPGGEKFETAKGSKLIGAFGATGAVGLLGSAYLFFTQTDVFAYSWLFAFFFAFTFVCGGCFWILLHSASNSGWGVAVRRLWEQLANMVLPLAFLGLPLLVPQVQTHLYEWMNHHREAKTQLHAADHGDSAHKAEATDATHAADADHHEMHSVKDALHHMSLSNPHLHILVEKYGYLNINGWYLRFAFYFFILWHIARTLRKKSVKQDGDGDIQHTIKSRTFSCRWLLFYALTVTFAAVDWLMTLDYSWFSTMWGVYIFAGCAWASMALTILLVTWLKGLGYLKLVVTQEHYHLMGKLLFAFTVFWAYIAFSQYFLIWYANITEETRFYLTRNTEGWRWVSIFIVIGHFIGPFVLLLSQPRKKNPAVISLVCLWILFMHMVDIYWNVIPERGPSLGIGWWVDGAWIGDIVALLAVVGTSGFIFLRSLSRYSLYPCRDPRLLESANVIN